MDTDNVGYLVYVDRDEQEGFAAVCNRCHAFGLRGRTDITARAPLWEVNIAPYKQHCFVCGNVLVYGRTESWPTLFEPKLRNSAKR